MIPNIGKNIHERRVKSFLPNIQEDIIMLQFDVVGNIHERSVKSRFPNIQEDNISFFKNIPNIVKTIRI
jgi:hypothetical protein